MPEQPVYPGQPIPQTSVAAPYRHPLEVTVQFLRYTNVGMTAYQKGQYAGFLRPQAEDMVRRNACRIVPMAEPVLVGAEAIVAPNAHQGKQQHQRASA